MSKLTLHVDDELIEAAKEEAANRRTSVSKLVSEFFRALSTKPARSNMELLPPVTSSLVGCLAGADKEADLKAYVDHLEAKHS